MSKHASLLAMVAVMMGTSHALLPPSPHPQRTIPNPPRPRWRAIADAKDEALAREIAEHNEAVVRRKAERALARAAIKSVEEKPAG